MCLVKVEENIKQIFIEAMRELFPECELRDNVGVLCMCERPRVGQPVVFKVGGDPFPVVWGGNFFRFDLSSHEDDSSILGLREQAISLLERFKEWQEDNCVRADRFSIFQVRGGFEGHPMYVDVDFLIRKAP